LFVFTAQAQEFDKHLTEARKTYSAGDLNSSRFAMEQMLRELDVAIGEEILKVLPAAVEALKANEKEDQVNGSSAGYMMGLFVQRSYGAEGKRATVEIVNNSPLLTSLNAFLAIPFITNSADGKQKMVKIQGYRSVLNKNEDTESGKTNYELQIPMQNTLVTLKLDDAQEGDILKMANTIPLEKIALMAK
jgi:hypothetical protein